MFNRRRLILLAVFLPFGACTGYLLFWPTGLDPEGWTPPAARDFPSNQGLAAARVVHPELEGPEAIAVDPAGKLVTGLADGRIVRFDRSGSGAAELVARTGGRPLGLAYEPGGRLIVADASRGLLAVAPSGAVSVLATGHGGRPFRITDDVAVAADGTIYFTDASDRFSLADFKMDILEHRPRGRVLALDPKSGQVRLVTGDCYFANGVALGPDDGYLVVTESASYRIRRIWLKGEKAGQVESWIRNLPGFPDNVRWSPERKVFWVALGSPRDANLDRLGPHPFLRRVVARLPEFLQPGPKHHAIALAFGEDGSLRHDLQATGERAYAPVASVLEVGGVLYLGSFAARGVAVAAAPPI